MKRLTFELGERRRITLKVWINGVRSFALDDPTWKLTHASTEGSGVCESEQDRDVWYLTAEVQPKQRGTYKLQYTFHIGSEIIKRTVEIAVI